MPSPTRDYTHVESFKPNAISQYNYSRINANLTNPSYQQYIQNANVNIIPKFDHAYILENYRKLRVQQRQQLLQLRIPDKLKKKFFGIEQGRGRQNDQQIIQKTTAKRQKDLVLFNHPFKGKIVMTKENALAEVERQARNAQRAYEKNIVGQSIPQVLLNQLAAKQQTLKVKVLDVGKSDQSQYSKEQQKKNIYKDRPKTYKQIAEKLNKQIEKNYENMYFIHKPMQQDEEDQNKREAKQWKILQEKQKEKFTKKDQDQQEKSDKNINSTIIRNFQKYKHQQQKNQLSTYRTDGQKQRQKKRFAKKPTKDIPIIGQEPKVLRDMGRIDTHQHNFYNTKRNQPYQIQYQIQRSYNINGNSNAPNKKKAYYRTFGNESEIKQIKYQREHPLKGSREGLLKGLRYQDQRNNQYQNGKQDINRSISVISAIQSNNSKDESMSNTSLNKALFME